MIQEHCWSSLGTTSQEDEQSLVVTDAVDETTIVSSGPKTSADKNQEHNLAEINDNVKKRGGGRAQVRSLLHPPATHRDVSVAGRPSRTVEAAAR